VFGGLIERLILRALSGNALGQVLVTLGISFIIADLCLMIWGGDPIPLATPPALQQPILVGGVAFPTYRLVVLAVAVAMALALHLLMDRTRIGAMIRAGVDDMQMARAVGIPVSRLFTAVFCLGAGLAGAGGIIGGPIMSAYPGLDADMLPLCARERVPVVLMHMQGTPATMQRDPRYTDVVTEVRDFLGARGAAARASGVPADAIVVDPGIGFGKTVAHNCRLLRRLDLLAALGYPVLVGVSRKGFIGELAGGRASGERLHGTAAAVALAVAGGARLVRVHDVAAMRDVVRVAEAVAGA